MRKSARREARRGDEHGAERKVDARAQAERGHDDAQLSAFRQRLDESPRCT